MLQLKKNQNTNKKTLQGQWMENSLPSLHFIEITETGKCSPRLQCLFVSWPSLLPSPQDTSQGRKETAHSALLCWEDFPHLSSLRHSLALFMETSPTWWNPGQGFGPPCSRTFGTSSTADSVLMFLPCWDLVYICPQDLSPWSLQAHLHQTVLHKIPTIKSKRTEIQHHRHPSKVGVGETKGEVKLQMPSSASAPGLNVICWT